MTDSDNRGSLIKSADQAKQQLAAGPGERQMTDLVEHDETQAGEMFGRPTLVARAGFVLRAIDQVDDGINSRLTA